MSQALTHWGARAFEFDLFDYRCVEVELSLARADGHRGHGHCTHWSRGIVDLVPHHIDHMVHLMDHPDALSFLHARIKATIASS
jgi:hypothetical protein